MGRGVGSLPLPKTTNQQTNETKPESQIMDIKSLDTKKGATHGAILHLVHPAMGHKLYSGKDTDHNGNRTKRDGDAKPITVTVRGTEAPAAVTPHVEFERGKMKLAADDDDGLVGLSTDFICSLIISISGIEKDGKPLTDKPADKVALIEISGDFSKQIADFAKVPLNFFDQG